MTVSYTVQGDWGRTNSWLNKVKNARFLDLLSGFGAEGVNALSAATPKQSGVTANSWQFDIEKGSGSYKLVWSNSHVNRGTNIAVILQYGHGTGTGGYVAGRDYINPALRPVFDKIAEKAWKVVTDG